MSSIQTFKHSDAAEKWATSEERTPLFVVVRDLPEPEGGWSENGFIEVDGQQVVQPRTEEITYTMPAKPNVGLALEYLRYARQDTGIALSWILEVGLGEEGYSALVTELSGLDDPSKGADIMNSIATKIQTVAMGGLEAPKG